MTAQMFFYSLNVEIERPPLAVRSNAGLGETMPRVQCFGKRQRRELRNAVTRTTTAAASACC